jgi:hypothetical protein
VAASKRACVCTCVCSWQAARAWHAHAHTPTHTPTRPRARAHNTQQGGRHRERRADVCGRRARRVGLLAQGGDPAARLPRNASDGRRAAAAVALGRARAAGCAAPRPPAGSRRSTLHLGCVPLAAAVSRVLLHQLLPASAARGVANRGSHGRRRGQCAAAAARVCGRGGLGPERRCRHHARHECPGGAAAAGGGRAAQQAVRVCVVRVRVHVCVCVCV